MFILRRCILFVFLLFSMNISLSKVCDSHEYDCCFSLSPRGSDDTFDCVFEDALRYIQWEDAYTLRGHLEEHKNHVCKNGASLVDNLLDHCLIFAANNKEFNFKNAISILKCIVENGANYINFIDKLINLTDYKESKVLEVFLDYGLSKHKKLIKKIVKNALKNNKKNVLQVIVDSKIKLSRPLAKKVRISLRSKNIIITHIRMLKELKERFWKKKKKTRKKRKKDRTQMESFLKVWFGKKGKIKNYRGFIAKLLEQEYLGCSIINEEDISMYVDLLEAMNNRERMFADHYVCYHAHSHTVGFIFDIQTEIKKWLKIEPNRNKDLYMRFNTSVTQNNMDDFLDDYHDFFKTRHWPDMQEPLRSQLLCVNFAPFANTGIWGECSLTYLAVNQSQGEPTHVLRSFFSECGLDETYLYRLSDIYNKYMTLPTGGGNMLQILIPKDTIDNFVYLSRAGGWPFDEEIFGLDYDFSKQRNKKTSQFLSKYINNPFSLGTNYRSSKELLNEIQGRLVFMPNFYGLESDVQIFKYNFISEDNKKKYKQEFERAIDQMMGQWIESQGHENMSEDKNSTKLLKLLKFIKQGKSNKSKVGFLKRLWGSFL